jgi:hypothetical protein
MSLGEMFSGGAGGGGFWDKLKAIPPEAWSSLGAAIASAPRNQWGAGVAQGLGLFTQAIKEQKRKASLAEALKGASGDLNPLQKMLVEQFPEAAIPQMAQNAFATPKAEAKPSGVQEYEYAKAQGFPGSFLDFQLAQKKAGASNTVINNLPPEIGARTAMGEGFTSDFENIKERVKKFYSGGPGQQIMRRGQMMLNTGEGGKLWADVETGKEALVRTLTGAGMAQAEAENQAARYGLSPYDTEFDALQKIERLKRDLENVAKGAYGARGRVYTPPEGSSYSDVDAILGLQ